VLDRKGKTVYVGDSGTEEGLSEVLQIIETALAS
jgi:hypothetical protein